MKKIIASISLSIFAILVFGQQVIAQDIPQDAMVYSYTVKGLIKKLPSGQGAHKSQLMIKHQAIPGYKGEQGTVVGMKAMTMPFSVDEKIDLSSFENGDCIEFRFDSWWKPKPGDKISKITKIDCLDIE